MFINTVKIAKFFILMPVLSLMHSCNDSNNTLSIENYEESVNEALQALKEGDSMTAYDLYGKLQLQTEIVEELAKQEVLVRGDTATLKKVWKLKNMYLSAFKNK